MSNRLAFSIGGLIAIGIALDLSFGWGASVFLARKFADLVEWLAFWR